MNKKNILVSSGSFKDVYTSVEACRILAGVIKMDAEIEIQPFCDGGEYTYDLLSKVEGFREITVNNVVNAYGKMVSSHYLVRDSITNGEKNGNPEKRKGEAHIISSEILRLQSNEDLYRNPLNLTDYGFGQLIRDALLKGYKNIYLYLGGTSTVSLGMGMLQALGGILTDKSGNVLEQPVRTKDLFRVHNINCEKLDNINCFVICDGTQPLNGMEMINELKIGQQFNKRDIMSRLEIGIETIRKITNMDRNLIYGGVAGSIRQGIDLIFDGKYELGGDYMRKLLDLDSKLKKADIVITGEGRLDNSGCGKTPAFIAALAKKYKKTVIMCTGSVDEEIFGCIENGKIINNKLKEMGIDVLISCQSYYKKIKMPIEYEEKIEFYRQKTPEILDMLLNEVLQ